MRLLPCGRDAVILEFADGVQVGRYVAGLQAAGWAIGPGPPGVIGSGVVEVVPAARTLMVRAGSPAALRELIPLLRGVRPVEPARLPDDETLVEVVYDGPDLDDVAAFRGTSREAVVAAHTGETWSVAFCGFAPGFAYLTSLRGAQGGWDTPRLESPRTQVPAGSVGLAGPYSGCYPTSSPGGWRLIGRTNASLWDPDADPPALLRPGRRVRFVDVTGRPAPALARTSAKDPSKDSSKDSAKDSAKAPAGDQDRTRKASVPGETSFAHEGAVEVLDPGSLTLVEDLGRFGHAAVGVGRSGAADHGAHRLANRLIGNDETAATLEVLAGGLRLRALRATEIAIAGAPVASTVDGRPAPFAEPVFLAAGAELRLGRPSLGLRSYVAILGGIAVAPVLGSRSRDTIAGLGPAPLAAGDLLASGTHAVRPADAAMVGFALGSGDGPDAVSWTGTTAAGREAAAATAVRGPLGGVVTLTGTWGPRADWFQAAARRLLTSSTWTVRSDSDRVGVRCDGPTVERFVAGELPSEAVTRGSIQIPPSGQPVIFLADAPTTGGYPVIGVLDPEAVDALAQARPGDAIRIALAAPRYPHDLSDLDERCEDSL